jgi:hypothetical protein
MKRIALILTITAGFFLAGTTHTQAQFGGLTKKVTAESLNTDAFGGLDFFAKAAGFYADAIIPSTKLAKIKADLEVADPKIRQKALATANEELLKAADAQVAKGEKLSKEAQEFVKQGDGEFKKGLTKWGAVGVSLGLAAKAGGEDAALVAAIPVAQEMIKDLPQLKKMSDAMSKLKKLK